MSKPFSQSLFLLMSQIEQPFDFTVRQFIFYLMLFCLFGHVSLTLPVSVSMSVQYENVCVCVKRNPFAIIIPVFIFRTFFPCCCCCCMCTLVLCTYELIQNKDIQTKESSIYFAMRVVCVCVCVCDGYITILEFCSFNGNNNNTAMAMAMGYIICIVYVV